MRRKIIKKKRDNEASEALSKLKGGKELEMAEVILKELAQRKKRKNEIKDKTNHLEKIKKKKMKTKKHEKKKKKKKKRCKWH